MLCCFYLLQQLFCQHPDPAETSSGIFFKHSTKGQGNETSAKTKKHTSTCFNRNKSLWKIKFYLSTYKEANIRINTTLPPGGEIWHAHQAHQRSCLWLVCNHSYWYCAEVSVNPCFMSWQPSIVQTKGRLVEGRLWTTLLADEEQVLELNTFTNNNAVCLFVCVRQGIHSLSKLFSTALQLKRIFMVETGFPLSVSKRMLCFALVCIWRRSSCSPVYRQMLQMSDTADLTFAAKSLFFCIKMICVPRDRNNKAVSMWACEGR